MKNYPLLVARVIETLMETPGARTATKFIDEKYTVKASRQHRRGDSGQTTVIVTFGRPNYAERQFIKKCKAAGEPFPVRKIQLKFYPKQRMAA